MQGDIVPLVWSWNITGDRSLFQKHQSANPGIPLILGSRVYGIITGLYLVDHLDGKLPLKAFSRGARRCEHTHISMTTDGIRGTPAYLRVVAG